MVTKNFCAVVATERYYEAAAVYTSSSLDNNNERHQKWTQMAENLGRGLAERSTELVYGGGSRGLMGVVSLAALEAGGKIQGWLLPEFVQTGEDEYDYPQKPHDRMALDIGDRRNHMYEAAQSFFFMPGGIGTLDEILDVVTKEYLKTYRDAEGEYHKPMIFVNEGGYYDNLIAQIEEMIKEKTVNPEIWKVIHIVSDEQEALKCFDEIRSQAPVPIVAPIGNIGGSHQIKVSAEPT